MLETGKHKIARQSVGYISRLSSEHVTGDATVLN